MWLGRLCRLRTESVGEPDTNCAPANACVHDLADGLILECSGVWDLGIRSAPGGYPMLLSIFGKGGST